MKSKILLIAMFISIPILLSAQTYIDPGLNVEAKVFAYKLNNTPTIDGLSTEWENIPWQKLYFLDKDYNSDGLADPIPSRYDFEGKYKAAWVAGTNVLYMLVNLKDDRFHNPDSVNWYNIDGMEIRIDPFDSEAAGEPSSSGTAFNIGFTIGENNASGVEGPTFNYTAAWNVNSNSFPKEATLEVAIVLPQSVIPVENYIMGFMLYLSDNDDLQDNSPKDKDAVLAPWPQRYYGATQTKIGIDGTWENIYYWGNIECISLNVINVASGGSIQTAVNTATEGSIIKIAAGTFTENIVIDKPYIQLVGILTETDTTKLLPADANQPVIKISNDDVAPGVRIQNIGFFGWSSGQGGEVVYGNKGIEIGSALTEVVGNYFTGFERPIIKSDVDDTKAYAQVFEDNHLYKCKGGINFNTPNTIMRYNVVEENTGGYGLESKGLLAENAVDIGYNTVFNHHGECAVGYGGSGVFTVHHNMFVRSEQLYGSGDTSGDDGIENQDAGGSTDYIYNNTIVGWKSDGMQLGGSSTGTSKYYIRNNLIAHCKGKDYDIRTTGSYDIDYGLSFNNNGGNLISTLGTHSVVSDPSFTNEFEDDFTILSSSPAVDAGLAEPFGFKVMYLDNGLDIGAYETGIVVSVEEEINSEIPTGYVLGQNYPNPFNPVTTINFSIPQSTKVTMRVYNVLGQLLGTLVEGEFGAGTYNVKFDGTKLSSGVYFYTLETNDFTSSKKMILVK